MKGFDCEVVQVDYYAVGMNWSHICAATKALTMVFIYTALHSCSFYCHSWSASYVVVSKWGAVKKNHPSLLANLYKVRGIAFWWVEIVLLWTRAGSSQSLNFYPFPFFQICLMNTLLCLGEKIPQPPKIPHTKKKKITYKLELLMGLYCQNLVCFGTVWLAHYILYLWDC